MLGEDAVIRYLRENKALHSALEIPASSTNQIEATLLARGEYNENHVFTHPATDKKLVLRINLGSQMHLEDQIGYEARALRLLETSGRTPHIHYTDSSKAFNGCGVLVEDWLPGKPLRYETDRDDAAYILADIHSVPLPESHDLLTPKNPLGNIVDECETMFNRYRTWIGAAPSTVARMDRWFLYCRKHANADKASFLRHIISTELNSQNFLINDDGAGYLVDWEKPLAAEVEQDLAHFLVPTTTAWKTDTVFSKADRDAFVETYRHAVGTRFCTEGVAARLEDYLAITCLRGITWSAMALAQHESGERFVADRYTLNKIHAFLDNDFLDMIERDFYSR